MTKRQQALLGLVAVSDPCPSFRDIADALNTSVQTVHADIHALIESGHLEHAPGAVRDLRVRSLI